MSRRVYINEELADIDDQTAIGIDISPFDPINLNTRKMRASNKFSIPRTFKNRSLLGYIGEIQSLDNIAYAEIKFEYYVFNTLLLGGKLIVDRWDNDRYYLIGYQKADVFQWMQEIPYLDFIDSFLADYLGPVAGVPVYPSYGNHPFKQGLFRHFRTTGTAWGTASWIPELQFLGTYNDKTADSFDITDPLTENITFGINYLDTTNPDNRYSDNTGSHFCTLFTYIMDYVEREYSGSIPVDFHRTDAALVGNVFMDTIVQKTYIRMQGINAQPVANMIIGKNSISFTTTNQEAGGGRWITNDAIQNEGKTLYDIFSAYIKLFGVVIDTKFIGGTDHYYLRRIDDIDSSDIVNFSGNIDLEKTAFVMPAGIAQENYIVHKGVSSGNSEYLASKKVICNNKNFKFKQKIIEIDSYIGTTVNQLLLPTGAIAILLDTSQEKSGENFNFLVRRNDHANRDLCYYQDFVTSYQITPVDFGMAVGPD